MMVFQIAAGVAAMSCSTTTTFGAMETKSVSTGVSVGMQEVDHIGPTLALVFSGRLPNPAAASSEERTLKYDAATWWPRLGRAAGWRAGVSVETEGEHDSHLPGGVVTFLFSDIEGSTVLFRELGDGYPALLLKHNELLRAVWTEHRGVEVRTEGDSFFVAFPDPTDAIRAGVAAVEALAAHDWPPHAVMRSRIGMHTGVGYARGGDYIAYPVHQAARVGSVGHGGQVIVSHETAALAQHLGDVQLHDLGLFRVRDFDQPIHLFQAECSDSPSTFRDLRTESGENHNITASLPPLRGRDIDISGIAEQLEQSRVVSVVGPGGVGKTLLASTLGRRLSTAYAGGCWFVDLASHTDASTLRGAVADALAVAPADLDDHLAQQSLLLLLDNAEQATHAIADLVVELTSHAPGVSILVTSREPLSISGERVWRLGLVDEDTAVDLFLERSNDVAPDLATPPRRADVAELCRRLDGLPLAIELAAARTSSLSVIEIIDSLDDRLRLLRSRRRDLDDRQRTVSGLIDWSYRLLDDDEQAVFRRLGSFSGSLELDGVVAACADMGFDKFDVSDIVWSLTEKSLVLPVVSDGTTRYRLLETVRAFAREAMVSAGELDGVQRLLGEWYRTVFDPRRPLSRDLTSRMADEIETLRVLTFDLAETDPALAQWLAWSIGAFHNLRDPGRGHAELSPLVEILAAEGEAVLGFVAIAANLAAKLGLLDRASELVAVGEALRQNMPAGSPGAALIDNSAALVEVFGGDFKAARTIATAALGQTEGFERLPLAQILGVALSELGDYEAALASFAEVKSIAGDLGALDVRAVATGAMAEIAHRTGETDRARELTGEALAMAQEAGLRAQTAFGIVGVARLVAEAGGAVEAVTLHAAADRILAETGQTMFGADQEISNAMKAAAREFITGAEFDRLESEGFALSDLEAFQQATAALDAAASRSVHPA